MANAEDTYASTCHRMFFQRWRSGVSAADCPDNDGHNVDTIDGLTLPAVVALAALAQGRTVDKAAAQAVEALQVTRASKVGESCVPCGAQVLPGYVRVLTEMLAEAPRAMPAGCSQVLHGTALEDAAKEAAQEAGAARLSGLDCQFPKLWAGRHMAMTWQRQCGSVGRPTQHLAITATCSLEWLAGGCLLHWWLLPRPARCSVYGRVSFGCVGVRRLKPIHTQHQAPAVCWTP